MGLGVGLGVGVRGNGGAGVWAVGVRKRSVRDGDERKGSGRGFLFPLVLTGLPLQPCSCL